MIQQFKWGYVVASSFKVLIGQGPAEPILSTGNRFRVGLAFERSGTPTASEITLKNTVDLCFSRDFLFIPDDPRTPTPTPTVTPEEPKNCCMDFDNSVDVTAGMASA